MSAPSTWGLLATASIGGTVVHASQDSAHTRFTAVASRDAGRARTFAAAHDVPRAFGSYDELLASDAAEAGGRLAAEGFMWRYHPRTRHVQELVAAGAIGTVHQVRAALSVSVPDGDIRRRPEAGGGALGDLGGYCVSAIRMFAGTPDRVYPEAGYAGGVDVKAAGVAETVPLVRDEELRHAVARTGSDAVYRIELDTISRAIQAGEPLAYGRDDAVEQAATLDALAESGRTGAPVTLRPGGPR